MQKTHTLIDESFESYVGLLKSLVSFPSIGLNREATRKCADYLVERLTDIGFETQVLETKGNPVIFGEIKAPREDAPTVLFYGHYDVQPEEPIDLWRTPPFEATVVDGRIYGRGVADNKGQFLCHLCAIDASMKAGGAMPINVKFVLDGEEEIGSEHLIDAIREHRELFGADVVITSDGGMGAGDAPQVLYGIRGVMNFDLTLETAKTDNHSGNKGGIIKNPAWEMMRVLKTMLDDDDRVLIDGFYDDVMPPLDTDWELIDRLPFDSERLKESFGVYDIVSDKKEYFKRLMFEPTLTINGLNSGYLGEACKNIIPKKAVAKMEVRFVYDMDPEKIFALIKAHVNKVNPNIKVEMNEAAMPPSRTMTNVPIGKAVVESMKGYLKTDVTVLPIGGGSLPDSVWTKELRLPSLLVPYGNIDEANHAPNENYKLDLFRRGIHVTAQLIHDLGDFRA